MPRIDTPSGRRRYTNKARWFKDFRSFSSGMWDEVKFMLVGILLLYAGGYMLAAGYIQLTAVSFVHPAWGAFVVVAVAAVLVGTLEGWMDSDGIYSKVDDARKYGNGLMGICAIIFLPIALTWLSGIVGNQTYKEVLFKIRFWPSAFILVFALTGIMYEKLWNKHSLRPLRRAPVD